MTPLGPCPCLTTLMVKKLSLSNRNFLCPNLAFNLLINSILPVEARKKIILPPLWWFTNVFRHKILCTHFIYTLTDTYDANASGINVGNYWLLMETRYDGNQFGMTDFHFVCPRHSLTVTYAESVNTLLVVMHFQIVLKVTLLEELLFAVNIKHL